MLGFASPPLRLALLLAALAVGTVPARAQSPWYEGFEGSQPTWQPAGGNARFEVLGHQRVRGESLTGEGCEKLTISAGAGTCVYYGHDVGRPRVIAELLPTVAVRSDRAGIQLLASVALPRTADPRTGRPLSVLVPGSRCTVAGQWQQLRIEDLPQQLARQAGILRMQLGREVDVREAYVDRILLNVYGGPGVTTVWIDDLDIAGHVAAGAAGPPAETAPRAAEPLIAPASPGFASAWDAREPRAGAAEHRVELSGSVLLVDGRPFFPRAIQYQGESLAMLRQLGFNAVWLPELPTEQMACDAAKAGVWLISPPPRPSGGAAGGARPILNDRAGFREKGDRHHLCEAPSGPFRQMVPVTFFPPGGAAGGARPVLDPIAPAYGTVLAWDLGRGLSSDQVAWIKDYSEAIRAADPQKGRPLVCRPESDLRAYSRYADLLLLGRSPMGTSLELADYGTWIRQRPCLARPGTPVWTTVQTQPPAALVGQWLASGMPSAPPTTLSAEQIRLMVYTAITAGSRGLVFESRSPLDAADADTRLRAAAMELLNLELELIEPFLAAGDVVTTVDSSEPEVLGVVLRTDRARLLVPIWSARGAQFVPGQSAAHGVGFIVPGVPESNAAYQLTPGGVEPLRYKRVTGGTRVTLDEFGLTALVLLTQDPLVLSSLTRRTAQIAARAAELERQLAAEKLQAVTQADGQLAAGGQAIRQAAEWLAASQRSLQWSDAAMSARDYAAACLNARRAMRPLELLERAHWEAAVAPLRSPVSSPAAVGFRTLPWQQAIWSRVAAGQPGANRLVGGECEDLNSMFQAGWRHFQHAVPGVYGQAELAAAAAQSGRYGLRLAVRPTEPNGQPQLVESPPLWIVTPPVPVQPGELLCIQGWVYIGTPITGSVDGLVVLDSLSGEALAERIGQTAGWHQFALYRFAAEPGTLTVTFALTGVGEACLDDVTICPIQPAAATALRGAWPNRPLPAGRY